MKTKLCTSVAGLLLASISAFAQGGIGFEENLTQYPVQVKYKAGIGDGVTLFMEPDRFTYVKYDPSQLEEIHEKSHTDSQNGGRKQGRVDLHAFQMNFTGANSGVAISAKDRRPGTANYFLGNDPAKWASNVASYNEVRYTGLYNGIDLFAYSAGNHFKYDFIVSAQADPSLIRMNFSGTNGIEVRNNTLVIHLSTGDIVEQNPYSYQLIGNVKYPVACEYVIAGDGHTVMFSFPNSYNRNYPLIIDPVVIAASYSGALLSTTTYGHCATYDQNGNIYSGGECFQTGYPVQIGSFQTTFAGNVDIVLSCLNPNGSTLLWSTYLGGSNREVPNSLFAGVGGDLYVLGSTTSPNYPTSAGCFDATGTTGADEDIIVTHVNSSGTALIGSTYVGGSRHDGGGSGMPWSMGGFDGMRGEIIVDGSGNVWVASFTRSNDFPVTPGAYDTTLDGTWDGVVFRLDATCSVLGWSTYIGGSAADAAYSLRLNSSGEVFCTGVTCSNDFPATVGTYSTTFAGGTSDGFIVHFDAAGTSLLSATYFGTADKEICYLMDIDQSGNPYVLGTSRGAMPVTAGVYSNAGALNFISKFDPALTALQFSTVFGDTSYMEPQAFMVDANGYLYCSGFEADPNYPVTAATALYPTQASCANGTCYFMILSPNATQLVYGTFYYGFHVDGGTSRFSPDGYVYQAICIGSGSAPTPAWAYKDNTNAPTWDVYVLKINFEMEVAVPTVTGVSAFSVQVFPNPASAESQVAVHTTGRDAVTISVYNSLGQVVWTTTEEPAGSVTRVQLPRFAAGQYIVEAVQGNSSGRTLFIASE